VLVIIIILSYAVIKIIYIVLCIIIIF